MNMYTGPLAAELSPDDQGYNARIARLEMRMERLEKTTAQENIEAPLRTNTDSLLRLAEFARQILRYDGFSTDVSRRVRDAARVALGLPMSGF